MAQTAVDYGIAAVAVGAEPAVDEEVVVAGPAVWSGGSVVALEADSPPA